VIAIVTGRLKVKQNQALPVIIIVAVLLIAGMFYGGFLLSVITLNTKTVSNEIGLGGVYGKGLGRYGGSCYEPLTEGELFDKDAYAVSWKPGVESETINIQGCIFGIFVWPNVINDVKYKLYWSDDGVSWDLIQTYEMGGDLRPDAVQYTFTGEHPNGAIKVELTGDMWVGVLNEGFADDQVFAYDHAYIYQGSGNIEILNENKIVEVGEDVLIDVEKLGYSAGRGWSLELFSYPQNRIVYSEDLDDGDTGIYRYTVTSADFVAWSGCGDSNTLNRLAARLYNNLWKQDEADADTIDLRANAPPQPKVTLDKDWYNVNDEIQITIEGERNPGTNLELCFFVLDVYYQPGLIQLHDDEQVTAVNDEATYTTDPLPQAGTVFVEVTAYDAGGRPANHTILQVTIKPSGEGCNPLLEDCDADDGWDIPWIWIIIIIVIVAVLLYFLFKKRGKK
jgi:hypothetical protein